MRLESDGPRVRGRGTAADWINYRERGSTLLLRLMAFLSCRIGRRASRPFLYLITAYFFLFARAPRRASRDYLRRALGREPNGMDRFRHVLSFATTIHDRVYLGDERLDLFDVSIEGQHWVDAAIDGGRGAFLMGAHVGSFEILGSIGRRRPGLRVAMAMYEDNARKINATLRAINPALKPDIIRLGHLEAMLEIRELLDRGAFVGMLGDRTLGDEATQTVSLMGAPARLPLGPMRAAALFRRPVIFMLGIYRGGNRYHVVFEPLADFTSTRPAERDAAVRAAIERYAALLDRYCRSEPYNWFNFFDFWRADTRAPEDRRP